MFAPILLAGNGFLFPWDENPGMRKILEYLFQVFPWDENP
jgi:hypothetical protein